MVLNKLKHMYEVRTSYDINPIISANIRAIWTMADTDNRY